MRGADMGRLVLITSGHDEEETPVVARAIDRLGGGEVSGQRTKSRKWRLQAEANPSPGRCGIHIGRSTCGWGNIMEPADVGESVELELGDVLDAGRDVVAKLAERERAAVA